jgi:hypothetical protein
MLAVLGDHGLRRMFQRRSRIWQVAGLERVPEARRRSNGLLTGLRPAWRYAIPRLVLATRDEPVNLSDSCSDTHQHCSPADANCCQSVLLDPDAMISIDLHRRLFLLVIGRGE